MSLRRLSKRRLRHRQDRRRRTRYKNERTLFLTAKGRELSAINPEEIIQKIEFRLSLCDSIEQTIDTSLQQADGLRQSILKQAFEGRI